MENKKTGTQKTETKTWSDFLTLLENQKTHISWLVRSKIAKTNHLTIDYRDTISTELIIVTEGDKTTQYQYPRERPSLQALFIRHNRQIILRGLLEYIENFSAIDIVEPNVYKFVNKNGTGQISIGKTNFNKNLNTNITKIFFTTEDFNSLAQAIDKIDHSNEIHLTATEFDIFQNRLLARFNYLVQKTKVNTANPGNTGR